MGQHSLKKGTNNVRKRRKAIQIICIIVIIICLAVLGTIAYIYLSQSSYYAGLADETAPSTEQVQKDDLSQMTVDWESLRQVNPDIVAWVIVPDTVINYPVVQGADNDEYLHKSFNGSEGVAASAGCIFIDSANASDLTDQVTALYGHHMRDGSMFAALAGFSNQEEFDAHRTIYVLTPTMNYRLTTFSVVLTTGSDLIVQSSFGTRQEFDEYLQDKLSRSVVSQSDPAVDVANVTQAFLLSTCEYSQSDGRAVIFAAVTEKAQPAS